MRLIGLSWLLQLKMASRSAFDGLLSVIYPLFFTTSILLIFRTSTDPQQTMLIALIGSAVMAVWSATSNRSAHLLQVERRIGTLELLVASPARFIIVLLPITLSMATIGLISLLTTLIYGRFIFGVVLRIERPGLFVLAILVTVLAIGMLGLVLSLASVRYRGAWALGAALELPVWIICGFLFPVSVLPAWVRPLSWVFAPTWGMNAIRATATGGSVSADLIICFGLLLMYAVLAILLSDKVLRSARVHATLALS